MGALQESWVGVSESVLGHLLLLALHFMACACQPLLWPLRLNASFRCGSNLNFSGSQGKHVASGRPVVAALVSPE